VQDIGNDTAPSFSGAECVCASCAESEQRLNALQNFAILAKYDFRVERQIGVCVAHDGDEIEVDWIFLDFPWQEDRAIEEALTHNYPFRPRPTPKIVYRYPTTDN